MGVYHMISNTWTFEPFIDGDGSVHARLGLWGDGGAYAEVTVSMADIDRGNRHFGDMAIRMQDAITIADALVAEGSWTIAKRDAYVIERCRSLATRLDVNERPPFSQDGTPAALA